MNITKSNRISVQAHELITDMVKKENTNHWVNGLYLGTDEPELYVYYTVMGALERRPDDRRIKIEDVNRQVALIGEQELVTHKAAWER